MRAVVFDVIGTLFSLESQRPRLTACGLPGHALEAWFAASLRDLFTLGITGRTAPMIALLKDNLHRLLSLHHLRQDGPRVDAVLDGMTQLDPDPEAAAALEHLASRGLVCAALSNGSLKATESLLERAGLRGRMAQVMSIDEVGLPKPRREVYQAIAARLQLEPGSLTMVAAHPWDLHGARAAGLSTACVSRGLPWPASLDAPDLTASGLIQLAQLLGRPSRRNPLMPDDSDTPKSDKTTANVPVSDIGAGGTRPAPSSDNATKPKVQSGDQNTAPDRSTDR